MSSTPPPGVARHRAINLPSIMRIVDGVDATTLALTSTDALRAGAVIVHSGSRSGTGYGGRLSASLRAAGVVGDELVVDPPATSAVAAVQAVASDDTGRVIIGVGGGVLIDIAKLGAARAGTPYICVPTQASSDVMCSPVAVIPDATGRPRSLAARMPVGIVVDMDVLDEASRTTWLAGLGDLISNLSAVRDWRWASAEFGEPVDDFACLTSEAAALSVIEDGADVDDREYREKLIRGLILSGIAMEMAGSSRPASGSEHLISHALDEMNAARRRPHGLQVAMATLISYAMRGDDSSRLVAFFRTVGLPTRPADLGLTTEDVLSAARRGPGTRPGRRTILDRLDRPTERLLLEMLEARGDRAAVP